MMTARDRITAAMERRIPDRVPVWCQLSLEHVLLNATYRGNFPQFIDDWVHAECQLTRRYHFDGVLLFFPGTREGTRVDDQIRTFVQPMAGGDLNHDFSKANPESWPREIHAWEPADFHSSRLARDILGPDYHIGGWTPDAFSRAVQWFPSMAEAMIAMIEDPARFDDLIAYYEEECRAWALAQVRLGGIESIHISSPFAGSSFISRPTYEELVLPQLTRLADALKPEPAFSYVHTCGFLGDRLELVASSGVDGIECLDPAPLGDVELADAKRRVGDRVFLKGNLDSVNVLWRGSDEEVDRAIQDCLRDGAPGGGYILSTACSVAPAVPPERLQKLAALAQKFELHYPF